MKELKRKMNITIVFRLRKYRIIGVNYDEVKAVWIGVQ